MKPFVLRFILKQKKLIIFAVNLVLVLSFLSYFLSFSHVQAVWLGMSRENTIDNLSNTSGDSSRQLIQIDSADNPYVIWYENLSGNYEIYFSKWTPGIGWTNINGIPGYDNISNNGGNSIYPRFVIDSAGIPYVVWNDNNSGNNEIYISKGIAGIGWTKMDGITLGYDNISNNLSNSNQPDIEVDSFNNPYVIWEDGPWDIYFSKWTPVAGWTKIDGLTPGSEIIAVIPGSSTYPKLKIDSANNAYVAWEDSFTGSWDIYLSKGTPGGAWTKMNGVPGYDNISNNPGFSQIPEIQVDLANNPYVIWADTTLGNPDIFLSKWTPAVGWTNMSGVPGYANISATSGNSSSAQFAIDSANNPYVVWKDQTIGNDEIYLSKWTPGVGWTQMDGVTLGYENLSSNAGESVSPKILLDSANRPYIVWHDETTGNFEIYFSKWTIGTGWTGMDEVTPDYENISNNSGQSGYSQIKLNNVNFPYLVWYDNTEGNGETYFTRWLLENKNQVNLSANIDPTLTLNLSSTTCDLGTFDSTKANTCQYDTTVTTNASSGYTAYIRDDGNLRNAVNDINDVAGGTTTVGSEEYGVATSDTDVVDITAKESGADCTTANGGASDVPALALTTGDQSYATEDAPIDSDVVTLCHSASIAGLTPAGVYLQTVTITAVGNF